MKKILLFLVIAVAAALTVSAAPLFHNQQTAWKIVISPSATATEMRAATELQTYLQQISGAKFTITRSAKLPAANAIVIGTPATFAALPAVVKNFPEGDKGNDSLRIAAIKGNLYLSGNVPRGALYAVYTFLKNTMGVRWFFAGKTGELVPRKSSFTLPELNIYDTAKFKYRGFHLCGKHYDEDMETWMSRNKLNIMRSDPVGKHKWRRAWNDGRIAKGLHMMFSTHNVAIRDRKVFAEHPEFFALVGGKRMMDQLCWSNPDVEKIMIDRLIQYCKDYPAVEIVNLSAADNMNYCRCEKCGKKPVHELWFEFYNRMAAGVRKVFPQVRFATIAYQAYKSVPACDMSSSAFVEYCMYDRCYTHRYGKCAMNDKALKNVASWQKKGLPILVYSYEFDVFKPKAQSPFYYMISDQMKKFHSAGIAGIITECGPVNYRSPKLPRNAIPGANYNKLGFYLYAAALWDHNVDPDAVIKEYSEAAYGTAAPYMAKYAMLMGKSWDKMKNHYSYFSNSPFACSESLLNGKLIAEIDSLFRKADAAVKQEKDPARRAQITANFTEERRIYNEWKSTYQSYTASKSNIKVLVTRAKSPWSFSGANAIGKFVTRNGTAPVKPWTAVVNHDTSALYFDIVCHDDDMKNLAARHTAHDSKVYTDDCIEIFLAVPNDTRGIYRHLTTNANGAKRDAIALGGHTFDIAWNPDWQVKAVKNADNWRVQIAIPFASLETSTPKPGDVWSFAIKRTNGGRKFPNSGFPDATYHDQNAFGLLQFTDKQESVSTLFAVPKGNPKSLEEMRMLMEKAGFSAVVSNDLNAIQQAASGKKVYIFRHSSATKYNAEFFRKTILPALNNGALVIFTAWGGLPLEKYFNDPRLKVKWSGWKTHRSRKTFNIKTGSWTNTPCNLSSLLKRGMAPSSAYTPLVAGVWNELAQMKLRDETLATFLMTTKVGKGTLVLTSADFGLSGGLAIFGSRKMQSVQLLQNLYQLSQGAK
ncbi:MAG: DUF4838 domain-containing protein [Lentisphaeria bacterium]|nr:DUF4838 domain-containing protein [Lentisphaeria bacterium]